MGHQQVTHPGTMTIDFDNLWERVAAQFPCGPHSIHGPDHWRRVERNGLLIAGRAGADVTVVRLFALFHDSRRENDHRDDGHGTRGAMLARELRGVAYDLPGVQFELLHLACVGHTDGLLHDDPTIGTCWDADRLDLGRVGITPDPKFMSTPYGKELARVEFRRR
jgi:uncharacterized protein